MKPIYKIVVDENSEIIMDFNSLVDYPAHMKSIIHFDKGKRYEFNEDKRIVTGVMISVGTPIERFDRDLGEYYVIFDAKTVDVIRRKFFKDGFVQNLNIQHDMDKVTKGATLVDSYIIHSTNPNYPKAPEAFADQKLLDGTWIASYHVHDDSLWADVKAGKFGGFSVEGWFDVQAANVSRKFQKMKKKSIWQMMGLKFDNEPTPEPKTFAQATTADGVIVFFEGDLAEGTQLLIEVDGEQVPAPEGEHQLTLEDGTVKVVMLDGSGIIQSIEEVMEDATEEIAELMSKVVKDTHARFVTLEAENKELKAKLEALTTSVEAMNEGGKFAKEPKKVSQETGKLSVSEILKMQKK